MLSVFKMVQSNEGSAIFNLVDGVVDEFNSESGVDTSESKWYYNSTSDFYDQQVNNVELLLTTSALNHILLEEDPSQLHNYNIWICSRYRCCRVTQLVD